MSEWTDLNQLNSNIVLVSFPIYEVRPFCVVIHVDNIYFRYCFFDLCIEFIEFVKFYMEGIICIDDKITATFFERQPKMLRMPNNVIFHSNFNRFLQNTQSNSSNLNRIIHLLDEFRQEISYILLDFDSLCFWFFDFFNKCKPFTINRSSWRDVTVWFIAVCATGTTATARTFITHFTCMIGLMLFNFQLFVSNSQFHKIVCSAR